MKRKSNHSPIHHHNQEDWRSFLTLGHEALVSHPDANHSLIKGHVRIGKGRLTILYQDREYTVASVTLNQHWPLFALASAPDDCPFRIYACFYIDDKNAAHVQYYELWVSETRFVTAMTEAGTFPREILVTKLIRSTMPESLGSLELHELIPKRTMAETLAWMQETEHSIRTKHNEILADLSCILIGETGWVYNRSRDVFAPVKDHRFTPVYFRGGILGSSSSTDAIRTVLDLVASDGDLQHSANTNSLVDGTTYLSTRATLVVVPYDLPHQWEQHLLHHAPQLRIRTLLTQADFDKTTMDTLLNATDVVLTTYPFIKSKRYHAHTEAFCRTILSDFETQTYLMVQPSTIRAATRPVLLHLDQYRDMSVPLQCFYWKRIVYDDMEQLFSVTGTGATKRIAGSIPKLMAECSWGISYHLNVGPQTVVSQYCNTFQCEPPFWTPAVLREIVETCFSSIAGTERSQFQEIVHWIEMSLLEQRLYEYYAASHTDVEKIQFCTYYNLDLLRKGANDVIQLESLETVVKSLMCQKQERLFAATQTLAHHQIRLRNIEERLSSSSSPSNEDDTEDDAEDNGARLVDLIKREKYQKYVHTTQDRIYEAAKSLEYFQRTACQLSNESSASAKCPICFDQDVDTLALCGHMYCRQCLSLQISQYQKCALCNVGMTFQDAYQIRDLCANTWGSKFTAIASLLHVWTERNEKVVVYSQFLPLLRVLRHVCEEMKTECALVGGNTLTRQSALDAFDSVVSDNDGRVNVLMVHLETQSIAMRVRCARHLVFIHALTGDPLHQQTLYQQALNIVDNPDSDSETPLVHWFLTKNTVEIPFNSTSSVPLEIVSLDSSEQNVVFES